MMKVNLEEIFFRTLLLRFHDNTELTAPSKIESENDGVLFALLTLSNFENRPKINVVNKAGNRFIIFISLFEYQT